MSYQWSGAASITWDSWELSERCWLTTDSVKTLVHALIATRLDYCNSVFHQISAANLFYTLCSPSWMQQLVSSCGSANTTTSLRHCAGGRTHANNCATVQLNDNSLVPVHLLDMKRRAHRPDHICFRPRSLELGLYSMRPTPAQKTVAPAPFIYIMILPRPSLPPPRRGHATKPSRFVCHSFCHSVCKSNQPISLKLGVMIGPTMQSAELV